MKIIGIAGTEYGGRPTQFMAQVSVKALASAFRTNEEEIRKLGIGSALDLHGLGEKVRAVDSVRWNLKRLQEAATNLLAAIECATADAPELLKQEGRTNG